MIRSADTAKARRLQILRSGTALTHPANIAFVLVLASAGAAALPLMVAQAEAQSLPHATGGEGGGNGGNGGAPGQAGEDGTGPYAGSGGAGGTNAGESGADGEPGFSFEGDNGGGGGGGGAHGGVLTGDPTADMTGGAGGLGGFSDRSGAGGGGAGGDGALFDQSATVSVGADISLSGGDGGDSDSIGNPYSSGGGGGAGVFVSGTGVSAELDVNGRIDGGDGGDGDGGGIGSGGGGGAGIVVTDGAAMSLDLGGSVSGGDGGGDDGTGGSSGGDGIVAASSSSANIILQDSAEIIGGAGKGVGDGGAGLRLSGGGRVVNAGTIQGGDSGGYGRGGGFPGPVGGTGSGGAAGNVPDVAIQSKGGVGIIGANLTIINSGLIAGTTGFLYEQAHAITFTGGTNRLELRDGYSFTGNVVANGASDIFALGGDASPADPFDLGKIVDTGTADATDEFIGFEQFEKTGTSTWALSGTGDQDWTIEAGMLVGNTDSFGGDLTFASGAGTRGVTFEQTDAGTYAGTISGAGDLNKTGAGTLTLTGDSTVGTFTVRDGTLLVDGGTLDDPDRAGAGGRNSIGENAGDDASLIITNGGKVSAVDTVYLGYSLDSRGSITVSGNGSSLDFRRLLVGNYGDGTLSVNDNGYASIGGLYVGANDYGTQGAGSFSVSGAGARADVGTLYIGYSAGSTGAVTLSDGGALNVEGAIWMGRVDPTGSADFNIGAAAGDVAAAPGTLHAPAMDFREDNDSLNFNHTGHAYVFDTPLTSIIAGAGSVNHHAGTTTVTGDSSGFSGTTTVSGGTLRVGDAAGNGELGGTVMIEDGGTLGGNGTVGTTAVADGGTIAPGSSIGTLTVNGNLSLGSGARLAYELGTPGSADAPGSSDRIDVSGDLDLNGTLDLAQSDDPGDGTAGLGYYRLMTYGGDLSGDGLQIGTTLDSLNGGYEVQTGGGNVDLFVATLGDDTLQHWQGGDGVWNAANLKWLNRDGQTEVAWAGHHAVFKNQPGDFDGGTISVEDTQGFEGLQFVSEGYYLAGDGALETAADGSEIRVLADSAEIATEITGAGGITKTEAGTLVLSGQNSYEGGTTINSGVVQVSEDANLGATEGGLTFNGGTLRNTAGFSTARDVTLNAGGGTFETDSHLTITGDVDGAGRLTKTGANILTLTGANTYTGGTVISEGVLEATVTGALGTGSVVIGTEPFEDYAGLSFTDTASASDLQITNHGRVHFRNESSAGNATIINKKSFFFDYNSTAGNAAIANSGFLDFYQTASAGSAIINNEGAVRFAGSNTADDATIVNDPSGRVEISNMTADGIGIGSLSGGGDVYLGSRILTLGGLGQDDTIGGTIVDGQWAAGGDTGGSLVKIGAGTLTLTGDSSYTGGTAINAGTLQIGNGGAQGSVRGDIEIASAGTLAFNRANDFSLAGGFSGNGQINKHGAGVLELTGDSAAFTGTTAINAGMLSVNGALGGSLDVGAGATLGGSGTVGTTTVADGGTITPGNSIGTLTVNGDLSLATGATLAYELGDPGSADAPGSSDRIDVTGDLDLNGTLDLAQSDEAGDGTAGLGYYRLMTYGGALSGDGLGLGTHPEIDNLGGYEIQTGGGNVDLFIAALGDDTLQHWQGGDGVWNAGNTQWLNRDGQTEVAWAGHHAVFENQPGDFDGGTIAVTGTQGFEGLQFVDEGYRLAGDGALETAADGSEIRVLAAHATIATAITGTGGITKTEAGTLVLSGQNSYQGGTTIAGGAVQISADANLGAAEGGLTFNGGQLATTDSFDTSRAVNLAGDGGFDVAGETELGLNGNITGTGDLFKQGDGTLTLSGENSYGNTHVAAGTLIGDAAAISGNISNAGTVIFEQLIDAGYMGALSGTGAFVKDGDGTLFYGGDGSGFGGRTTVAGGMLSVDGTLGGSLDVGTGATLGGSGTVGTTIVADGGTITPGNSIGTLTVEGDLTLATGATLAYELGTPGSADAPGSSDRIDVTGDLDLNGTLDLAQSDEAGDGMAGLGYYRLMTYGGELSGDGLGLGTHPEIDNLGGYEIQTGGGNVDLFIAALGDDTLQHWQGGDGVWNAGNTQWLNRDGQTEVAWAGHHAVFKNQPGDFDGGTISVEGTQGFEGLQFVDEGYRLAGDGALQTAAEGSEIRVLADSAEIATTITGTGGITKTEGGTLVLSGQNSYQGGTTIAGGAVQVSADGNLGAAEGGLTFNGGQLATTDSFDTSRAVNLASDGGFDIAAETELGLTGAITGAGDLFKQGDGTLTLSGENSYGNTHVAAGTLIGDAAAISGNISNAGTVIFEQTDDAGYMGAMAGTGAFVKDGDGTLFYGGDGSGFGGRTTVAGGMLSVNGTLGGSLDVGTGAALGGSGTVGTTIVADGGTITPGNSIGTLTVNGDLSLATGATLAYELGDPGSADAPGSSDRIDVIGDLDLNGTLDLAQSDEAGDGMAGLGYYRLMTYGGELSGDGLGLGTHPEIDNLGGYEIQTGGGNVDLFIAALGDDTLQHWQGGDGVWNAGNTQWLNRDGQTEVAWAGHHAVFKNQPGDFDGGTISVEGTQGFEGLQFVDEGYRLAGDGALETAADGSEIRVLADSATIATTITGTGGITKTEAGTLVLSGQNSYQGGTTIAGGAVQISADANLGAAEGGLTLNGGQLATTDSFDTSRAVNLASDGGFDVAGETELGLNGNITGTGDLFKQGDGTLTLSGENSYGNTHVTAGTLIGDAAAMSGNISNAGTVIFEQTDDAGFMGALSGTGAFVKDGDGTLFYGGDGSGFGGRTTVAGGMLSVNGTLGGSLDVGAGATLGGSGTVGTTIVADGGTITPGNSIGTLTVNGDLTLSSGSRYVVEVMPESGDSDLLQVAGHAGLEGGSVAHIGATGNYDLRSSYTILSAEDLEGSFDDVTSNFAFLNPDLIYDYDLGTVSIELVRNDRSFVSAALTRNQKATAGGIESIGFDTGHAVYDAIAQLGDDDALIRASFDALSGEIHASAKSALIEDGRFPREAANDRLRAAFGGSGTSGMSVIGFAEGRPGRVAADTSGLAAWGQAFGAWGEFDSDGNAARFDRSSGGFLMGADALVGEDWRLGALAGIGHGSFDADDRQSSGSDDNYHFGLYGGRQWNDWSFRSGLAYTRHDIETSRSVAIPGYGRDKLEADYDATSLQAFGELGYRFETATASYEPFVGLAHLRLKTDGFTERGGEAALHVAEQKTETSFATVGVRASKEIRFEGMSGTLRGMLGWRHAFGDTTPLSHHAFTGSDAFTIAGVPIAEDAAVIEAGIDLDLSDTARLGLSYQGQFGSGVQESGLKADLKVRF